MMIFTPTKLMVKLGNQPFKNGGWTSRVYTCVCVQYRYIPWDVLPTKGDDITSSPPTITQGREQPKVMKAQVQMMFLLQW